MATKNWVNGQGPRPTVWFKLYRKTSVMSEAEAVPGAEIKELANGTLSVTWTGLRKTDDGGNLYTFSVKEVDADGNDFTPANYTKAESGLTVTNTYVPPTAGEATATKVWVNGPTPRPTVWFKLYRQIEGGAVEEVPGAEIKELADGTLSVTWTGLTETDINGNAYTFSVKEVDAEGNDFTPANYTKVENGLTVTNTYTSPVTVTIKGTKTLSGRTGTFSDEFKFTLDDGDEQALTFTSNGTQEFTFALKTYTLADLGGANSKAFTYKVSELASGIQGMVDDADLDRNVTVTVTDNKDGTLSAVIGGDSTAFTNTYSTSDANPVIISGTKTLSGRTGQFEDKYTFTLSGVEKLSDVVTDVLTFTSNGSDTFGFGAITYTWDDLKNADGTYSASKMFTYKVTETYDEPGVTQDGQKTVVVLLTDNGNGTLSTRFLTNPVTFTNIYEASGSLIIQGSKTLNSRTGACNDVFEFTLDGDNKQTLTFTENATKSFNFPAINYTLADLVDMEGNLANSKEFTYEVKELPSGIAGMVDDPDPIRTITVTVTDGGEGELIVSSADWTVTWDDEAGAYVLSNPSYTNTYRASGDYPITGDTELSLNPTKELAGRILTADAFTFELKKGDTLLQTKKNLVDGTIPFENLTYTEADVGEHTYTITEVKGTETGMTYDEMVLSFTVVVTDLGDGKLEAKLKAKPEDTIFNNSYEAGGEYPITGDTKLSLNPTKELTGRILAADAFTFQLKKGGTLLQTVKNKADGSIPFAPIAYNQDQLGEHTYTITEVKGSETGMTYDEMVLSFTVVVTDLGDGKLEAKLKAMPEDRVFNNSYEAGGEYPITGDTELSLNPTKELTGRTLTADAFTFLLKKGGTLLQTKKNLADGSIPFAPIAYNQDQLGEHTYTITEVKGSETGMTYDEMVLSFTVVVSDLGGGKLKAELKMRPADSIFNNKFTKEPQPIPVPVMPASRLVNNLAECFE